MFPTDKAMVVTARTEPGSEQALGEGQPSLSSTPARPIQLQCHEAGPPCAICATSRWDSSSQGPSALTTHMPIHKALLSCLLGFIFKNSLCACTIQAAESPMCVLQLKSISRAGCGRCSSFQAPARADGHLPTYCHSARSLALPPLSTDQGGCFPLQVPGLIWTLGC